LSNTEDDPIRIETFDFVKLNIILNNYLAERPSSRAHSSYIIIDDF